MKENASIFILKWWEVWLDHQITLQNIIHVNIKKIALKNWTHVKKKKN